jgi:hypothetical protein
MAEANKVDRKMNKFMLDQSMKGRLDEVARQRENERIAENQRPAWGLNYLSKIVE